MRLWIRRRRIRLTSKHWNHITSPASPHAYMTNHSNKIKETLPNPDKIIPNIYDDFKSSYYKFYKNDRRYLRAIIRYLNGEGFVITAYFVRNIKK